eukprot:scaffold3373_cov137-Cylindrotheca_fusiformis.AAC.9
MGGPIISIDPNTYVARYLDENAFLPVGSSDAGYLNGCGARYKNPRTEKSTEFSGKANTSVSGEKGERFVLVQSVHA